MSKKLIHGACPHDCPDTCGVITEVENGMPAEIRFTEALPKTRSGKIMRRLLRDIAAGRETVGDTSTIEDYGVLARLRGFYLRRLLAGGGQGQEQPGADHVGESYPENVSAFEFLEKRHCAVNPMSERYRSWPSRARLSMPGPRRNG